MMTENSLIYDTIIGCSIVLGIVITYAATRLLYINCKKEIT